MVDSELACSETEVIVSSRLDSEAAVAVAELTGVPEITISPKQ